MQKTEAYFPYDSNRHASPFHLTKMTVLKGIDPVSLPFSNIKKTTERHKSPRSSAKNELFHEDDHCRDQMSFEEAYSQIQHCLSLIKDPLWKSICTEMMEMMGPFAVLKMWDSCLGSFSYQHKTMNVYCSTQKAAHFVCQYSFVILGSLQRYFPMMKDLKVKIKP